MLTYQKYFYPLQMQVIVGENMMELGAAMKDQPYVQYQQKRYEGLLSEVQGHMERNKGVPDKELNKLIDSLDKADLKTTGWTTTPLENVDHDFVSTLLNNFLKSLNKRKKLHDNEDSGFAMNMRRGVEISEIEELIN